MTKERLEEKLNDAISDLVSDFVYYDRKESESFPAELLDEAIQKFSLDEIVEIFRANLKVSWEPDGDLVRRQR